MRASRGSNASPEIFHHTLSATCSPSRWQARLECSSPPDLHDEALQPAAPVASPPQSLEGSA
eukprot:3540234-Prorocentrum_lima.AAC.1